MQPIINAIAEDIWVLIPLAGISVAIIAVPGSIIGDTLRSRQYERSRREIAAYIAEGSMSPEEGERLLQIKSPKC